MEAAGQLGSSLSAPVRDNLQPYIRRMTENYEAGKSLAEGLGPIGSTAVGLGLGRSPRPPPPPGRASSRRPKGSASRRDSPGAWGTSPRRYPPAA